MRSLAWGIGISCIVLGVCTACSSSSDTSAPPPSKEAGVDSSSDAPAQDSKTEDSAPPDVTADTPPTPDAGTDTSDSAPDVGQDAQGLVYCTLNGAECLDTQKCAPVGIDNALICVPNGDKGLGEACGTQDVDDCQRGLACLEVGENLSVCRPLCNEAVPCKETYQGCFPFFGPFGTTAGACMGDDCRPPATGCKDGDRCTVLASGEVSVLACLPAGPVPVGGDCTTEQCAAGAMCVASDGKYTCRSFCDAGAVCGVGDLHCAWPWPFEDVGLCTSGCDPLRQTGCRVTEACYFADPTNGETVCWEVPGTLDEGQACDALIFCDPGFDCVLEPGTVEPNYEYYCRKYCDAQNPCPQGFSCENTDVYTAFKFCMPSDS